jgi:putative MATE family efflux protein
MNKEIRVDFYRNLLKIGAPIMLQQLLIQGMRLLDSLMIGSLGEKAVIAVGNAAQISFLMFIFLFGVGSSASVFASQFWGKGDCAGIKKTLSLSVFLSLIIALPFFLCAQLIPEAVMALINPDAEIVRLGAAYLRIDSISYFFFSMTLVFTSALKGTRQTRLPLITSFIAVLVNAFLNWVFIFGNFGMPRLGVSGAAIGTTTALILEFFMIYALFNRKKNPVRMRFRDITVKDREFIRHFMKNSMPVIINEVLWAIGNFGYTLLFNRMSETAAAAMAIFVVLERMCYVVYIGLGHSACILVGNKVGAGDKAGAYEYGKRLLRAGVVCALVIGAAVFMLRGGIASIYNVADATKHALSMVLAMFSLISWTSIFNYVSIVGILRGGGDTRFAAVIDIVGMYALSLPAAYLLGLVAHLPVYIVYLGLVLAGEIFKLTLGLIRFRSRKWIRNLVDQNEIFEVQL